MNATGFDADVIIIGSGPAGVSAAFPLVEAGTRVLMMDGAGGDGVAGDDEIAPWKKMLGRELQALLPEDGLSPKLRSPTSRRIVGAPVEELIWFSLASFAKNPRNVKGLKR